MGAECGGHRPGVGPILAQLVRAHERKPRSWIVGNGGASTVDEIGRLRPFLFRHGDVRQTEQCSRVVRFFGERVVVDLLGLTGSASRQIELGKVAGGGGKTRLTGQCRLKCGFRARNVMLPGFDHPHQGLVEGVFRIELDERAGNLGGLADLAGAQLGQHQSWAGHRRARLGAEHPLELSQSLFALTGADLRNREPRINRRVARI